MTTTQTPDLTYTRSGMFTSFISWTPKGDDAWIEMAKHTNGTGKVLRSQEAGTIAQLRASGYTVRKSKPVSKAGIDAIYAELDI